MTRSIYHWIGICLLFIGLATNGQTVTSQVAIDCANSSKNSNGTIDGAKLETCMTKKGLVVSTDAKGNKTASQQYHPDNPQFKKCSSQNITPGSTAFQSCMSQAPAVKKKDPKARPDNSQNTQSTENTWGKSDDVNDEDFCVDGYQWSVDQQICVSQASSANSPAPSEAAQHAKSSPSATNNNCVTEITNLEMSCYQESQSAANACEYEGSTAADTVEQVLNNLSAVTSAMARSSTTSSGFSGLRTGSMAAQGALGTYKVNCARVRNSCVNTCEQAQSALSKCSSTLTASNGGSLISKYMQSVEKNLQACGDLQASIDGMESQLSQIVSGMAQAQSICEQNTYKNNPICTGALSATTTSTLPDCFAQPTHAACIGSGTQTKVTNSGVTGLPTGSVSGRAAGVTGGSLGGGGAIDSSGFALGGGLKDLNDVRMAAKPNAAAGAAGGGGGFGSSGGGAGGAGGGSGAGPTAAGGGGEGGTDLDLNMAKISGDESLLGRRFGMGNGNPRLGVQRDSIGNIIYPSGKNLKMDMNRFRPNMGGGRGVAGMSAAGPDGITGFDTNIWKKINTQYNHQEDTLD